MESRQQWGIGRRIIGLLIIICLFVAVFSVGYAEETAENPSALRLRELFATQRESITWEDDSNQLRLAEYLAQHEGKAPYVGEDLQGVIDAADPMNIKISFQVAQPGFYHLAWQYASENKSDAYASITLDGAVPYQEASIACFRWQWEEAAPPQKDAIGDEIRSQHVRSSEENSDYFINPDGFVPGYLPFYLEEGSHEFIVSFTAHAVDVTGAQLCAQEIIPNYEDYLKAALESGLQEKNGKELTWEAEENVLSRNSAMIRREFSDDPLSTPYEMGYKRLNTIGGNSWSKGGQALEWKIQVPEDGLYTISLRCAVNTNQLPVCRTLRLDGKVPFEEMLCYRFSYVEDLQMYTIPYLFALEKGEHTLSMIVNSADFYPIIQELENVNNDLSRLMLDLVMLVGTNPDINYDYDVEKGIPDISDQLKGLSERLSVLCEKLNQICEGVSLAENSLRQNAELLLMIERNIERIQNNITDITSIQTNLALWTENLQNMPLQLDTISLGRSVSDTDKRTSSGWQKTYVMLNNFITSFSKDYDQVGARNGNKDLVVLDVWATMSIEEADILKNLCDTSFTSKTGIAINLNIMPAGQLNAGAVNALLLSIVSGNEPDVAIGVGAGSPVELAIREAVVDLSKLPGYDELIVQFPQNTIRANSFRGGVYGIPERLDFSVLYYRKDILSSLDMAIPETWTEVYNNVLPVLYQNSLEMYVPENYATYSALLYQNGGAFYTPDGLTVALDNAAGSQAFKTMVEMYTKYAIPYTANFYNKFRTGEIPIGVAGFGDYMSLTVGASNLNGKWGVALIPGTEQADGTISHAISNTVGTSSVLLSSSLKQEAGWEFIKWWLSAETQANYAMEVEMRISAGSRVNTANTEAFKQLNWPKEHLEVLLEAREQAIETPGVLGGIYTQRHITNAWNAMITDTNTTLRDEFERAVEMIQNELDKKQEEYKHLLQAQ